VLAVSAAAFLPQAAWAWKSLRLGVGVNVHYSCGGNCLLWGLYRCGQPPWGDSHHHGHDMPFAPPFPPPIPGPAYYPALGYAPPPLAPAPYHAHTGFDFPGFQPADTGGEYNPFGLNYFP
jgi:hypothetical protein